MCKARGEANMTFFLMNIREFCPQYRDYVIVRDKGHRIIINYDHANIAGSFLGYRIDNDKVKGG